MPAPPPPREFYREKDEPPPLKRAELVELWKTYPCPTVRRLLLEIARLRGLAFSSHNVIAMLLDRDRWEPAAKGLNARRAEKILERLSRETAVREVAGRGR